ARHHGHRRPAGGGGQGGGAGGPAAAGDAGGGGRGPQGGCGHPGGRDMKTRAARVLVVDDDPAMLRTVERILSPRHEVRGYSTGEEAIEAARREPFDVAIVDVRMPGLDGFEVTRAIRTLRPRTEVVLVTGSVTDLDDKL